MFDLLRIGVFFGVFNLVMLVQVSFGQHKAHSGQESTADSLYASGEYRASALLFAEAFESSIDSIEHRARLAHKTGSALLRAGDRVDGITWFQKAVDLFGQAGNWDNHFLTKGKIANIHDDNGDFGLAIELNAEVVAHFKQAADSVYAAKAIHNQALHYYHGGQVQQAISLLSESIGWVGNQDDLQKAISYNQLGNIWADDLHDERKALTYYLKSLELKLNSASPQSISASYNNVGISYKNLDNPDSALFFYQKALEKAIESQVPRAQVNPLINLANLHKREGRLSEAVAAYQQALGLSAHTSALQQLTLQINLGTAYNEWHKHEKALEHLSAAEKMASDLSNLGDLVLIQSQKALAFASLKNFKSAYEAQLSQGIFKDSLFNRERAQEIADIMVKYESAEKDLRILEQQQAIQAQQLALQKRTTWFVAIFTVVLLFSGLLYYLFKRKEALAKQTALELRLAEQKELTRIQQERLRISRELHDNIGAYLTLMSASVEQYTAPTGSLAEVKHAELKKTLAMSMRELRKTVWLLNKQSVSLDEIALRLRDFFKPLHQNGTQITVRTEGNSDQRLSETETTHLFRIIQEAINNAYKYADCSEIAILLCAEARNTFCFSIIDDGKGFNVAAVEQGNGLLNMQSRMEELHGDLTISSVIGQGTTVKGCFQLKEYEQMRMVANP